MKAMFISHGILKLVFSDNDPEFALLEFRKFAANMTLVVQNFHSQMAW